MKPSAKRVESLPGRLVHGGNALGMISFRMLRRHPVGSALVSEALDGDTPTETSQNWQAVKRWQDFSLRR